ncbi:hypothetical protein BDV93DRAFT_524520 [Ceratobasidium sp. AG-I]|nr:hypothetical protein BDV93DRAFT_524520 [Ceratobasidium sp. AG-I]
MAYELLYGHGYRYHPHVSESSIDSLLPDPSLISRVTLDSLLLAVLPDLGSDLDRVYSVLVDGDHIKHDHGSPRWSCFTVDPALNESDDDKLAFAPLSAIFDAIEVATGLDSSQVQFSIDGNEPLYSTSDITSRPDAYFHLTTPSFENLPGHAWVDVAMPVQVKKISTSKNGINNQKNVIRTMHEIMRTDPRRRYVFGLTIEDTQARFWFHDRCNVVCSEVFDIHMISGVEKTHAYFYALAVASAEDLGFDSTCQAVAASATAFQYDFKFRPAERSGPRGTIYRAIELISDAAVDKLMGPGTRVWKVQRLNSLSLPYGPFYALKDAWTHCGRDPEHDIIGNIIAKRPDDARYFLTILDAEFVEVESGGVCSEDNTHREPAWINALVRRHYRMVSQEVGVSLYQIRNFQNALLALEGGFRGLYAAHMVGYIHRDVSAGNIMFYDGDDRGARGIIMDWEYGKRKDAKYASHDVKTGTAAFMSTEVSNLSYLHHPQMQLVHPSQKKLQLSSGASAPAFRQNYLHDHESNWWVALWLLFTLFPPERRSTKQYTRNYNLAFNSSGAHRWVIWSKPNSHTCFSHLVSSEENEYLDMLQYWNGKLKQLYEDSYARGEHFVPNDATIDAAHKIELEALDYLRKVIRDYPPELLFYGDLQPAKVPLYDYE